MDESSMLEVRARVASELHSTEKSYCNAITQIVVEFLLPIRGDSILKASDVKRIFSNIEEIQNLHMPLLHDLEMCVRRWSDESCIGQLFASLLPYLSLYQTYCANYHSSVLRMEEKSEGSGKFATFLQQRRAESLDLASLLIQPIQRIPRYRLLLNELLKHTPKTHPDYSHTAQCLVKIEEIASFVNESVRERDNQKKLAAVQASLSGSKLPEIVAPHRKFLKEGVLVKLCRKIPKRRHLFLFNDMLIYTAPADEKGVFDFHRAFDLAHVRVQHLDDTGKVSNSFQVLSNQKSFTVVAESYEMKQEWMDAIRHAVHLSKVLESAKEEVQEAEGEEDEDGVAPVWVPDKLLKNCMLCDNKFTALNRRHHCRKCGKLVCNSCSSKKFKLPNIGKTCRVCDPCYRELTTGEAETEETEKSRAALRDVQSSSEAQADLVKRATKKLSANRPTSGIRAHVEQFAGPSERPTSLAERAGVLDGVADSSGSEVEVREIEVATDADSGSSRDSLRTEETERHRRKRSRRKANDSKRKGDGDDSEKRRKKKKKSRKKRPADGQEEDTAPEKEDEVDAENVADAEDEADAEKEDEADAEDEILEVDKDVVVVVLEEEECEEEEEALPEHAPPPPPARNADGFFEYSSDEDDEQLMDDLDLPARAPPPPPPDSDSE